MPGCWRRAISPPSTEYSHSAYRSSRDLQLYAAVSGSYAYLIGRTVTNHERHDTPRRFAAERRHVQRDWRGTWSMERCEELLIGALGPKNWERKSDGRRKCCLVGARGFEPPTPASRTQCATGLRYAPTGQNRKTEAGLSYNRGVKGKP